MLNNIYKIPQLFEQFFEDVGHGKIKKSSIAAILILGTSPIPLAAALLVFVMQHFDVSAALDMQAVHTFYLVAFMFSGLCIVLSAIGLLVKRHQQFSYLYILVHSQLFGIGIFCLCYFLGVFSSPILLTILMSTGVGAVIFDKRQLLYALSSVFILMAITAVLQNMGLVKVLPLVKSMAMAERYLFEWYIYVYALLIPVLTILFSLIVRALMKEYRSKYQELESLAFKLAKYLSPQVYHSIFSGSKDVHIETYRKKLTIFFSDLKGFSELTETMDSDKLSSLLNGYLNDMSAIALKYGGTIDKFMGDSIMIFFGDPDTQGEKQDAVNCVMMALEMREHLERLKKQWIEEGLAAHALCLRIGINTGYCTVGNFGSDNRIDYTIIGGQVNLASRLLYSADDNCILISHESYALVNDEFNCLKKEKISVKGIHRAIQTYEVNEAFSRLSEEKKDLEVALKHFLHEIAYEHLEDKHKLKVLELMREKLIEPQ